MTHLLGPGIDGRQPDQPGPEACVQPLPPPILNLVNLREAFLQTRASMGPVGSRAQQKCTTLQCILLAEYIDAYLRVTSAARLNPEGGRQARCLTAHRVIPSHDGRHGGTHSSRPCMGIFRGNVCKLRGLSIALLLHSYPGRRRGRADPRRPWALRGRGGEQQIVPSYSN